MSFHNVKLESSSTTDGDRRGSRRRPPARGLTPPTCLEFVLRALLPGTRFRVGLARTLSRAPGGTDRHLTARYDGSRGARHGIAIGACALRFPRTRLSRPRPPATCGRWTNSTSLFLTPFN